MRKNQIAFVSGVLLALPVVGSAVTIRDDVGIAGARAYGAEAQFAPIGAISSGSDFGSGTLISDRWVLTAWHVVRNNAGTPSATTFKLNGVDRAVSEVHLMVPAGSDFNSTLYGGNDLALLKLTDVVSDVNPAQLYLGTNELTSTISVAGVGRTGIGSTGETDTTFGIRSAMRNTVDLYTSYNGSNIVIQTTRSGGFLSDFDDGTTAHSFSGSSTPLDKEGNVAFYDSGGAAFIEENGQFYLAGVSSWRGSVGTSIPLSGYGSLSGFTSTSWNQQWIQETAGVPEPGTVVVLAGLGAIAARRRKRK